MGVGTTQNQRQWMRLDSIMRMVWVPMLVVLTGMTLTHLDVRPTSILFGYAIVVLVVAVMSKGRAALLAIGVAAILAAYELPPAASFAIAPPHRLGYGVFLVLCVLIFLHRPPRSGMPLECRRSRVQSDEEPSTEAGLPTIATASDSLLAERTHVINGQDMYQWERACAHLSDLIWDAQNKLEENDGEQAHHLLQHAYEVAAQTRRHILEKGAAPVPISGLDEDVPVKDDANFGH